MLKLQGPPCMMALKLAVAKRRFSPMGIGQAGVLFFRPCAGVARHMMQLAQASRFVPAACSQAEQAHRSRHSRLTLLFSFVSNAFLLVQDNYSLQYRYHDAEQTFLDW